VLERFHGSQQIVSYAMFVIRSSPGGCQLILYYVARSQPMHLQTLTAEPQWDIGWDIGRPTPLTSKLFGVGWGPVIGFSYRNHDVSPVAPKTTIYSRLDRRITVPFWFVLILTGTWPMLELIRWGRRRAERRPVGFDIIVEANNAPASPQ
jgi:hypothetical protein